MSHSSGRAATGSIITAVSQRQHDRLSSPSGAEHSGHGSRRKLKGAILHLIGPTTTGKTSLAVLLAGQRPVEALNSDKFHCYNGFTQGTGSEDLGLNSFSATHLYRFLGPSQPMLVEGDYLRLALPILQRAHAKGSTIVIDGSSFSYNSALLQALAPGPEKYIPIAISWNDIDDCRGAIAHRVANLDWEVVLHETRAALSLHGSRCYVLSKGVVHKHALRYLEGSISLDALKLEVQESILEIVRNQTERYMHLNVPTRWARRPSDLAELAAFAIDRVDEVTMGASG